MTPETLALALGTLLVLAGAVERAVAFFKPLTDKVVVEWQPSVKIGAAVLLGFGLAALWRCDFLAAVGVPTLPVLGYLASGFLVSLGAATLHSILGVLQMLKNK